MKWTQVVGRFNTHAYVTQRNFEGPPGGCVPPKLSHSPTYEKCLRFRCWWRIGVCTMVLACANCCSIHPLYSRGHTTLHYGCFESNVSRPLMQNSNCLSGNTGGASGEKSRALPTISRTQVPLHDALRRIVNVGLAQQEPSSTVRGSNTRRPLLSFLVAAWIGSCPGERRGLHTTHTHFLFQPGRAGLAPAQQHHMKSSKR